MTLTINGPQIVNMITLNIFEYKIPTILNPLNQKD